MRPVKGDYNEYYQSYINLVTGDDIFKELYDTNLLVSSTLNMFPQSRGDYRYAEGKWTLKEVIGHMMDTDRIFAYRALSIARGEMQPLPGFDQNQYVITGKFNNRPLFDLAYEYRLVRETNLQMFRGFDSSVLQNRGTASGYEVTVLALMYMIAGHEKHHLNVLKEKYL
jgi:uncharacterized damage-inducible protein DinB